MSSGNGVSVVIASHRPRHVPDLVESIQKATKKVSFPVEIIVAADYPITELQNQYGFVKWFYVDDKSISKKRNVGVAQSLYDIIGFVDDDCLVDEQWLNEGVRFLSDNQHISAVEGKTSIEITGHEPAMVREYKRLEKPGYRTNNIFYRKKPFLDIGGFDERFTFQREDLELAFSILKNGGEISYSPQIRVMHKFRFADRYFDLFNL